MPVLPLLYRRLQAAAEDTRIIDARQWEQNWEHGVEAVRDGLTELVRRAPEVVASIQHLTARSPQARPDDATTDAASVARRQDANVCSAGYIAGCYQGLNAGPAPGAVVGIVLGSVAGFLLLIWVLYTLSSGSSFITTSALHEESDIVVTRRHHSRSPRRSSHRSSYREEMRQTTPAPPRRERVVRQERISREIPRDVSRSRVRETIIVDDSRPERRVEGDDVIEVIEGSDMTSAAPPPRRKSGGRRTSTNYRSVHVERRRETRERSPSLSPDPHIESGYRRVDPDRFAGGGFRQHRV